MELSSVSDGGSPVLTIFIFIFLILGALGWYIYNENQKRATETAGLKVRENRAAHHACGRWR